jgi:hypothetical protein
MSQALEPKRDRSYPQRCPQKGRNKGSLCGKGLRERLWKPHSYAGSRKYGFCLTPCNAFQNSVSNITKTNKSVTKCVRSGPYLASGRQQSSTKGKACRATKQTSES